MTKVPVFDGHNDLLTELTGRDGDPVRTFLDGGGGHIDLPRAREGGFAGGFFAVWIRSPIDLGDVTEEMQKAEYDLPMPPPIDEAEAVPGAMAQIALLHRLEAAGGLQICTDVYSIEACIAGGTVAAILHFEGAEAIDPDFHALEVFHRAGLRSLGPVWSRNTIYGEGVPFRFPSTGDVGGGLTDHGKALVMKCNEMRVMIDLSHLNEAGFWDVARLSDAPLVATHSNVHALCPHARNLTDKQLAAIAESGGLVGLNFATAFLREDGAMVPDVPIEQMLRHLDHMIGILGEDGVGMGSDFDGAVVPEAIGDLTGLPKLVGAMEAHGYGAELIERLCWKNWMRVLRRTWGEGAA